MIRIFDLTFRSASLLALAAGFLVATVSACSSGAAVGPSSEHALPADSILAAGPDSTAVPPDSTAAPVDSSLTPPVDSSGISTAEAVLDNRSRLPGIVFLSNQMPSSYFNSVHTGAKRATTPDHIISILTDARARGARMVLKLTRDDRYTKNSDGTFSFTKWKALVDGFKGLNLSSFITDGTLIGHFMIDEPHMARKWGGKTVPHATVEAMAQYSRQIWPDLNTLVHTKMSWLAESSITYRYLDAGWAQYASNKGPVATWAANEVAAAKRKGLGLVMGLNVINGGNGSSGIRGTSSGKYSMSANELRTYGTTVLDQSYVCAFVMWEHKPTYYERTDIASAMSALSVKARAHVKTSCRQ